MNFLRFLSPLLLAATLHGCCFLLSARAQSVPGMRNSQYRLKNDIPTPQAINPTNAPLTHKDSVLAIERLQNDIRSLLSEHEKTLARAKTQMAMAVYSLNQSKELFALNPSLPLTPASTTKLFTTFAALDKFGANYTIETLVLTDADGLRENGVLDGNIYLVGQGDPLLSINDLELLASQLYHAGVRRITGSIFGDDGFFDRVTNRRQYSGDDDEVQPTAPISALGVQRNLVTVIVGAGGVVGKPVHAQTFPASDAFEFDIRATVAPTPKQPKKKRRGKWAKPALSITEIYGQKNGKQRFLVQGTLSPNTSVSRLFFIEAPPVAAADMFRKRVESFGITVEGGSGGVKEAPSAASELASMRRPLLDVVNIVNKKSDNFAAEHVFKLLGGAKLDARAPEIVAYDNHTIQASIEQLQGALRHYNIVSASSGSLQDFDGSGLSRRNKISPISMIRLLELFQSMPFANEFVNSLAIAGLDGTLQYRMRGTTGEYNVRAKTGTHKNVSALAGYVRTLDGERLAFSFLFNGNAVGLYKGLENKLCQILANFSYYTPSETSRDLDSTDDVYSGEMN